ncbi:MAG TPA: hypothetical protein VGA66_01145 [Mycobacterium sp.]
MAGGTTDNAPGEVVGGQSAKVGAPIRATRTAPYDYGCAVELPCRVEDSDARNGRLRVTPAAEPCMYYGPPFACAKRDDVSTYAGVRVAATGSRSEVAVSAVVRRTSGSATGLSACFALVDQSTASHGYSDYCYPLGDGPTTIRNHEPFTMTDARVLYVYLAGDGTATVERISFTLT